METLLSTYLKMSAISLQMVEASGAGEWERLIALENLMSGFRDALKSGNAVQVAGDTEQIAALIRGILEDDVKIRQHVEPWLEHIQQFLDNEVIKQRVAETYGVK